jgi:hypothetical protein
MSHFMSRGIRELCRATLTAVALMCSIAATSPPKPADKAAADKAVADLKREFAAHAKDPTIAKLRTDCDYFKKTPGVLSADAVFDVLERQIPGDFRLAAYAKWQMLSALPPKLDAKYVSRLVSAYERAPLPGLRYGASNADKKKLDAAIVGGLPQDDVKLSEKLQAVVDRGFDDDQPILAYRDELYHRLPPSRDKFIAAVHDAMARLKSAAPKNKLAEALQEDLPKWVLSGDAKPYEVKELADIVGKLRFVESPSYYGHAGVHKGKLAWVEKTDKLLTPKKLADLHKVLLEASDNTALADAPAVKKTAPGNKTN